MIDHRDLRIRMAMEMPEAFCLAIRYDGGPIRIISPTSATTALVSGFCLCREDYRHFDTAKLELVGLVWSWSILPPVPMMETMDDGKRTEAGGQAPQNDTDDQADAIGDLVGRGRARREDHECWPVADQTPF